MTCSMCGSTKILKDDPPVRGYALTVVAIGVLFVLRVIDPAYISPLAYAQHSWIEAIGLACLLLGGVNLFRHANRYCGSCGFRFRIARTFVSIDRDEDEPSPARNPQRSILHEAASMAGGQADEAPASRRRENKNELDPQTPIEPILACLRFKDPKQRQTAADTLARLTGQDFGPDADAWYAWWAENKVAFKAARRQAKADQGE